MSSITSYCRITSDICTADGKIFAKRDDSSDESWFKQIYRQQELAYPKFHKMDSLSQAGILASEVIRRNCPSLAHYADDSVALLFANRSSSADTDARFIKSYEHAASPSPSLFVYTLPNIVIGEIAILNKWYGENMFAVLPAFSADFYLNYVDILLSTGSEAVLCGWVEVLGGVTDVLLFLVEKSQEGMILNAENLDDIKTRQLRF